MSESSLDKIRALCEALPDVEERLSHGAPTWFIRGKKSFLSFVGEHHGERMAFWCAARSGLQEALVAESSERYFRPAYVGGRGWLGVYLDGPQDWAEIEDLVAGAYDAVAPPSRK